ncbi:Fur family transcriptional regulator [Nitratifractor sp.]
MTNFAEVLKSHGLKATFQRMTILAVIEELGHASIDEIYENVLKTHPTLSLATVYKNIVTMVEQGVLVEVPISGRKSKYELKKHEHLHLICTECGSVTDRQMDEIISADTEKIARDSAFRLHGRQVNLYGVCEHCAQKAAS